MRLISTILLSFLTYSSAATIYGDRNVVDVSTVVCNPGDQYLADPESCNHFYQCSNGKAYHMPCAAHLVFNPNIRPGPVCVWPDDYHCVLPEPTTTTTAEPEPTTTTTPEPELVITTKQPEHELTTRDYRTTTATPEPEPIVTETTTKKTTTKRPWPTTTRRPKPTTTTKRPSTTTKRPKPSTTTRRPTTTTKKPTTTTKRPIPTTTKRPIPTTTKRPIPTTTTRQTTTTTTPKPHCGVSIQNIQSDWNAAGDHCKSLGLGLARVESEEKYHCILGLINETGLPEETNYWTAANDQDEEGHFIWSTTHSQVHKFFGSYPSGHPQPDNNGGNENCASLRKVYPGQEVRVAHEMSLLITVCCTLRIVMKNIAEFCQYLVSQLIFLSIQLNKHYSVQNCITTKEI